MVYLVVVLGIVCFAVWTRLMYVVGYRDGRHDAAWEELTATAQEGA